MRDISLEIAPGELLVCIGPSGCGKTTLLKLIAGFLPCTLGKVLLDGEDVTEVAVRERQCGIVFQSYALFPHMRVWENVAYALRVRAVAADERRRSAEEMLDMVGLGGYGDRLPAALSGGQQQRVALARALVFKPRVLLLDEPLSALDAATRLIMREEIRRIQKQQNIASLLITHDQDEALSMAGRIAVMNKGEVAQLATPSDLYEYPANRFVADFIGTINLIAADVVEATRHGLRLASPGLGEIAAPAHEAVAIGSNGALAILPEHLRISGHADRAGLKNHFTGAVVEYLFLGDVTVYKVRLDNGLLLEALATNAGPGRARFHEIGDRVSVEWRHDAGVFLPD